MHKLLVYIVLLMHVNTYMFFPMIDEKDVYDSNGKQKDDINSLAEYIYQVVLGHKDNTPEDEDDDQAHFYHVKYGNSYIAQYSTYTVVAACEAPFTVAKKYAPSVVPQLLNPSYDIYGPPPEA